MKLTALLIAATLLPSPAPADELHLSDGTVLQGRLQEETRRGFAFLSVDAKRPKTHARKDVERVVLTWSLPDFLFNDPQWSQQMVDARISSTFREEWGEVEVLRSEHFIVFTNSSAGKKYLVTMEDIYDRFIKLFPFEEQADATLMPVLLYKTNDHYFQFTSDNTSMDIEGARRTGGHATRDYYATYYQAPGDSVHYHEGAHQMVANRLRIRGGGSWFQEGMAVFFEGTLFPGEDPAKGMKAHIKSQRTTPLAELITVRSLLGSSKSESDPGLGRRRYQQAGAVIKFLFEGPHKDAFPEFLERIRKGQGLQQIAAELFETSLAGLDAQFAEFYGA